MTPLSFHLPDGLGTVKLVEYDNKDSHGRIIFGVADRGTTEPVTEASVSFQFSERALIRRGIDLQRLVAALVRIAKHRAQQLRSADYDVWVRQINIDTPLLCQPVYEDYDSPAGKPTVNLGEPT